MAARKKTARRAPARRSTRVSSQPVMPEYISMPPTRRFGNNPLLILLVIVLAFFTGFLFFKVQNLEKGTTVPADQQAAEQAAPSGPVDVDPGHLPVLGDKNAPVTVIEFADFQCPFCKQWSETVGVNLKKDYIDTGKVKFYYRHYAFLGDESNWAAEASECANEQGKFWEYHDFLFENQGGENEGDFSKANLESFAAELGLDTAQFNSCLESGKYTDNVKKDLTEGQKAGVQGTPATFVNGMAIDGAQPYSVFKDQIDQELAK